MKVRVLGLLVGVMAVCGSMAQDAAVLRTQAIGVLKKGFGSEEFWPSMHAAEALTAAGETKLVIDSLKPRLAKETDDQKRCGLSREIMRAGDLTPLAGMVRILRNPDTTAPVHVCESLFKVGQIGDAKMMAKRSVSRDDAEALMAAGALAKSGNEGGLQRIRAFLSSYRSLRTRRIAAWLLGQIGDKSDLEALGKFAESAAGSKDEPLAAPFAINAMAKLGAVEARAKVLANLESEDKTIRAYAAQTLGVCGTAEHLAALGKLLKDDHLDARIRAAEAIVRITSRAKTDK